GRCETASPASPVFRVQVSTRTSGRVASGSGALGSANRRLKEKDCLAGSDGGLVFSKLLAAPGPGVAAHRAGHREVMREAALGRAVRAIVVGGGEHGVVASGLEPFHDSFIVEAVGG